MVAMTNSQRPIDILTLTAELRSRGDLERVGGEAYISDLLSGLPDRPLSDVDNANKLTSYENLLLENS